MKRETSLLVLLIGVLIFTGINIQTAFAATKTQDLIYVDCAAGIDQPTCGNISSPCKSLFYTAPKMDGGVDAERPDIMYIKGNCSVNGSNNYNAPTIYPRGSYVEYTTWPGQPQAFIDGGSSPTGTILGSTAVPWYTAVNHITLNNLKINGEVSFRGTANLVIKNCDFFGGGTTDLYDLGTWCDVLFMEGCPDSLIINNKFHDLVSNTPACDRVHSNAVTHFWGSNNNRTDNTIFEYNSFYRITGTPMMTGLYFKDNPETVTVRYNSFTNLVDGVMVGGQNSYGHNVRIYNNIFNKCGSISEERGALVMGVWVLDNVAYNNDFINSIYADISAWNSKTSYDTFGLWNNLFYDTNPIRFFYIRYAANLSSEIYYMDYNSYYSHLKAPMWTDRVNISGKEGATNFNSLQEWQSHVSTLGIQNLSESNSVYASQHLYNTSGGSVTDLRLTKTTPIEIKNMGRGGNYPSYIGAWDPNKLMWIGYCDKGVGNCNVSGEVTETPTSPTGTLPSNTTSTQISVATQKNSTCKYSTTPNTPYASMAKSLTSGTTHSATVSVSDGNFYKFYVQCNDSDGEIQNYTISFNVAAGKSCGAVDASGDGVVDISEVMNYVVGWKAGQISIDEVVAAIREWEDGC